MKKFCFDSRYGQLCGFAQNGVVRFGSLRYAISKRFEAPVPVDVKWSFQNISEKPVVCPQKIYPLVEEMIEKSEPENFEVNESCQFLTINAPDNFENLEKLPVIVWIHGGSYEIGCGDLPSSDPYHWVQEQQVVFVSLTYRLGVFGFLGESKGRPANLGLLDIIEALKWIRKYIEIFGGNPDNVTLLGQSSGGDAAAHLMIAELPQKLFHKVIIHSAPLLFRKNRDKMYDEMALLAEPLLKLEDPLKMVELEEKSLPKFSKYAWKSLMPFGLQYGKTPLPSEMDADKIWQEKAAEFEVLIGLNSDETSFYTATRDSFSAYQENRISRNFLRQMIKYSTNKIYGKPSRDFAKNLRKGGGNVTHFTIHSKPRHNHFGAAHCFDLPLLFGNENVWKNAKLLKDTPWNYIFENGKKLRAAWTDFAKTGKIREELLPEIVEISKI